jgi:hypothetical protein
MIAAWKFARKIARRSTPPAAQPPSPPAEGSGSTTIVGG